MVFPLLIPHTSIPSQSEPAVLSHILFHVSQYIGILGIFLEVLMDILYGYDGVYINAELLLYFHNSSLFAVLTHFAAVYRDEHIGHLDITAAHDLRHYLTHSCTGSDNIFHQNDAIAAHRLVAYKVAAFAMVLLLLAVEEVGLVQIILQSQSRSCYSCQRDTLVSRVL